MNREQFIAAYMAAFLGARASAQYDLACSTGNHAIWESQPVEDAKHLAELAWESIEEIGVFKQ